MSYSLFHTWLHEGSPQRDGVRVYAEVDGQRGPALSTIRERVLDHLVGLATVARAGGLDGAADLIQNSLPQGKQTQSGDLGEILATEYLIEETTYDVPLLKLRYKDDSNMAMRGNDVIGVDTSSSEPRVVKGECKSRDHLSDSVVEEAAAGLDKDEGRPKPSTLAFITKRLYEMGRDADAEVFRKLQADNALKARQISHLVFTLSGNDAAAILTRCPTPKKRGIKREKVGIVVQGHPALVDEAYRY